MVEESRNHLEQLDYGQVEDEDILGAQNDEPKNPEHSIAVPADKSLEELIAEDRQRSKQRKPTPAVANSTKDQRPNKKSSQQQQSYQKQFTDGKLIGGQMIYEADLVSYQNKMRGRRLFVSNLDWETTWRQLKDHMRQAGGGVARVDIFTTESGKSKGCGVVEYETKEACQAALEQMGNGDSELMGRKLFLKLDTDLHPLPGARFNTDSRSKGDQRSQQDGQRRNNEQPSSKQHQNGHESQQRSKQLRPQQQQQYRSRSRDRTPPQQARRQNDYRENRRDRDDQRRYNDEREHQRYHDRSPPRSYRDRSPRDNHRSYDRYRDERDHRDYDRPNEQRKLVIETRDERLTKRRQAYTIRCDNLPTNVDSFLLKKAFKDFGRVEHCVVVENDQGESEGHGFVEFATRESAISAAKQMDRAKFNGKEIKITHRLTE